MTGKPIMTQPGAPLSTTPPPFTVEVGTFGDMASGDGMLVTISQGHVVYTAKMNHTDAIIGIPIEGMLEAISEYNRKTGS